MLSRPLLLAAVLAWWTLHGFATAAEVRVMGEASGAAMPWSRALTTGLASAWLWVPLTLAILWLVRRSPIERRRLAVSLLLYGAAVAAIILVRALMVLVLNDWIQWYEQLPPLGELLLASVRHNLFMAWMLVGIAHGLLFAERASQRERQARELQGHLAEARLEALAAQLEPHFLFNALNSIAELVHQQPAAAERMLVRLGELLRRSLEAGGSEPIALREELRFLRHYLEIERMRLGPRLRVDWRIDEGALETPVPPLILQPLVENAIRHGVAPRVAPGSVWISAARRDGVLVLEVGDDGPGLHGGDRAGGIGLANTRARLDCLYGAGDHLTLTTGPGGGTTARLTIPAGTETG